MQNKTYEKKASSKNGILKLVFFALAILIEIAFIWVFFYSSFRAYIGYFAVASRLSALLLVIGLYSQKKTPSIKMPWIMLILVMPMEGITLYLLIGLSGSTKRMRKRFEEMDNLIFPWFPQDATVLQSLHQKDASCFGVSNYILRESGYPVYTGAQVQYFDSASDAFEVQKQDMLAAKKFIFMEYFTIEDKESWQQVEDILEQKVREGVEVRVFYDDIGSLVYTNKSFVRRLESKGIRCRVFNPVVPVINMFLNNRDHRKMTVIDGEIGYTGGYNIANEYFNVTNPYGHWKDTGVRLQGKVVEMMTATFLEMWNAVRNDDKDDSERIAGYFPEVAMQVEDGGYVQFYADNPMDTKPVGEDVYMNMTARATEYLYFMTPYLILTDEMCRAIEIAAKRGVDVRIITPGIPDKKMVYQLTRSYYQRLVEDGVRIFEYTPGFCHAKMSVSDDIIATCGTINLDYRSLYHHFEDGCLLIGNDAVGKIREDFDATFPLCREVTEEYRVGKNASLRFVQLLLRLIAPLL